MLDAVAHVRGVTSIVAILAVTALSAAGPEKRSSIELPAIKVKAGVPLVKVGEFKIREPRFAPAAVAHGRFVYIVAGGKSDGVGSGTIERFNVDTGRSEIFARLKVPRLWHSAVLRENKIYVIGGFTNEAATASVEIVDLDTRAVTQGPSLPFPLASFGCVTVDNQIGVIGGKHFSIEDPDARSDRLVVYDPKLGWKRGPPMPTARETAAVVTGPFLIVPGGYDGHRALTQVEVHDLRDGTWRAARPLCRPMSAHSLVLFERRLFLFGDYTHPEELLVYDLATEASETFTLGYTPARHTAAVVLDRKIYVIGGRKKRSSPALNLIQVFALQKDASAPPAAKP